MFGLPLVIIGLWFLPLWLNLAKPTLNQTPVVQQVFGPPKGVAGPKKDFFDFNRLAIHAPMSIMPETSPLNANDWSKLREALHKGVGLSFTQDDFESAPLVFVTGHSSDVNPHQYGSVFAGLNQSHTDDTFTLHIHGKEYKYKVVEKQILNPLNKDAFLKLGEGHEKQRVVLVTCWPVLTTKNRLVVVGERVE